MVKTGHEAGSRLGLWVVGGWVRDRLLEIDCADVDIALSTMTGRQFGDALTEFASRPNIFRQYQELAAEHGIRYDKPPKFQTVPQNLVKSKKLEPAVGKVFGLDVDLINLRKEIYDDDSRTPVMEFGTAEEDALRRDATVNALFFNLDTQRVEDFTGRGWEDIANKIMRTPLDPQQTFLDDPLRVLRLIRLGGKLGFDIDNDTMKCMKTDTIHDALDVKVSRDRINLEVTKIMKGQEPQNAFQVLFDANLWDTVFFRKKSAPTLHSKLEASLGERRATGQPWPNTWPRAYRLLARLLKDNATDVSGLGWLARSGDNPLHLWTLAAYAPIASLGFDSNSKEVVAAATNAMRLEKPVAKLLESCLKNIRSIITTVEQLAASRSSPESTEFPRSSVGTEIRDWGVTWRLQVVYSLLAEVMLYRDKVGVSESSLALQASNPVDGKDGLGIIFARYHKFVEFVTQQCLTDAHAKRPLFNGDALKVLFGVTKGGTWVKRVTDELVVWQFDHEEAGLEEVRKWLLENTKRLRVPLGGE